MLLPLLIPGITVAQTPGNPFTQAAASPVPVVDLWASAPYWIDDGDYVHPAFSPDGSHLAFSDVVVVDSMETTEILVFDLTSQRTRRLLDKAAVERFAVYKVFVTDITWQDPGIVQITLSDGDVGASVVQVDPTTGGLLSEPSFSEGDDLDPYDTDPSLLPLRDSLHAAFPQVPNEVVTAALQSSFVRVPGRGVIIQKNYAGQDDDIWLLDLVDHKMRLLLRTDRSYDLAGGVSVGSTTLFMVSHDSASYLFALNENTDVTPLAQVNCGRRGRWLDVKAVKGTTALFRIVCHATYEEGNNPLFVYSPRAGLRRSADVANAYDIALSSTSALLAIVAWEGSRRRIGIAPMVQLR